jgi:hypothetical protein
MDYKGGTELWKHQWGEIQDPDGVWFSFWQDEEDGALYTVSEVKTLLDTIRYANRKTSGTLQTSTVVSYQDIVDDINLADSAGVQGMTKEEFLSSFTHEQTLPLAEVLRSRTVDTSSNLPSDYNPIILANKAVVAVGGKNYKLTINGYAMTSIVYTSHIAEDMVGNESKLVFYNATRISSNEKSTYKTKTSLTDLKNIRKAFEIIVHDESGYGTMSDLKAYLKIKGNFILSGTPTITNEGITLRLKRKYSNSKITVGELTVDGDDNVKLVTLELKKGTQEQCFSKCNNKNKTDSCHRIWNGTYRFELNTKETTLQPQHRYKSFQLHTKNIPTGNNREGVLMHTGWNDSFTDGCILTISHNNVQAVIDNPNSYIGLNSNGNYGFNNINYNNSAPTTMSLYEYVEKYVPNGVIKGKIVITEDGEVVVGTITTTTSSNTNQAEERGFWQRVLDGLSNINWIDLIFK